MSEKKKEGCGIWSHMNQLLIDSGDKAEVCIYTKKESYKVVIEVLKNGHRLVKKTVIDNE